MMSSFTRRFKSDKGVELEVDGSYRHEGTNSIEIIECAAWLWTDRNDEGSPLVDLTPTELERLHEELMADPATWEYDDDY